MSHELDFTNNENGNMIYVGETPWHGFGTQVEGSIDPEDAYRIAGLGWDVEKRNTYYDVIQPNGEVIKCLDPARCHLVRNDTQGVLGYVSPNSYHIHQPRELFEFYRNLLETYGLKVETMGSLREGKRIWMLAKINRGTRIMGQDEIVGYLLIATSYDGTLATTVKFTSVRVVCNNTLEFSMYNSSNLIDGGTVKIAHKSAFVEEEILETLGLIDNSWKVFEDNANKLATKKVDLETATDFFSKILGKDGFTINKETGKPEYSKHFEQIMTNFHHGQGATLVSAKGTAWGMVNAVTEYYDHQARTRGDVSNRLNSAWFGKGSNNKNKAFSEALKLAA